MTLTPYARGYLYLCGLFLAALVVCNLIFKKFFSFDFFGLWPALGLDPITLSVGALPYPLTFLVTDIISEVYGRRHANAVVAAGFFASLFVVGTLLLAAAVPAASGSPLADADFAKTFGNTGWAVFASMSAYVVAQFVDVQAFHWWRRLTRGRHLWLRNNASTMFSQVLDSTLVVTLLFWGDAEMQPRIPALIRDLVIFKLVVAAADTPFCYLTVWAWRRRFPEETAQSMQLELA